MVDFSALMIRVISYLRMQLPSHNVRKPQSDEEEGRVGSWVGGFLGGGGLRAVSCLCLYIWNSSADFT